MKKTSKLTDETIRRNQRESLIQDFGMILFLGGLFTAAAMFAR